MTMTMGMYVIANSLAFLHECAHGITAIALGGYFPFLQIDADGGRSIYFFSQGAPIWKEALVLLAGALVNFLVSLMALGLIAATRLGGVPRILTIYTGGVSALMLVMGVGLVPPWWAHYKETGAALSMLGFSYGLIVTIKSVWLLFAVILFVGFFRLFFRELSLSFANHTYRDRFRLVSAVLIIPVAALVGALSVVMLNSGFDEGVINPRRHYPHVISMVVLFLLLPLAISSTTPAGDRRPFMLPRRQLMSLAVITLTLAILQPLVFGNDRSNPRGLFLTAQPPEVSVAACNVSVTMNDQRKATVRLLMRPYPDEYKFLWRKVEGKEPADWETYRQFAIKNIPVLLNTQNFRVTAYYNDPEAAFFNKEWGKGARIVEAEADLTNLQREKGKDRYEALAIVDFWKMNRIGYLDLAEVKLEGNLQVKKVVMKPVDAGAPTLQTDNYVQWLNPSYSTSFTAGFILFGPLEKSSL